MNDLFLVFKGVEFLCCVKDNLLSFEGVSSVS